MSKLTIKQCFIFIFIGFILLAIDLPVNTGINYPSEYENSKNAIGEYQYYNIKTFYGATCTYKLFEGEAVVNPGQADAYSQDQFVDEVFFDGFRLDIFNDVVAFLLIAIAGLRLSKHQKGCMLFAMTAIAAAILKLFITILPFMLNGLQLCNIALTTGISYTAATVFTLALVGKTAINIMKDNYCLDEIHWLYVCNILTLVCTVLIPIEKWLLLHKLSIVFMVGLTCLYLLYGYIIKRVYAIMEKDLLS